MQFSSFGETTFLWEWNSISLWATYRPTYLPTYLPPAFRFFNFSETWHTWSSRYINVRNFRVLVKQLSYGNEIQFQISKLGKKVKGFPWKKKSKKVFFFRSKLAQKKFTGNKCAQFWKKWGFILQNQKKIRFQVWKSGKNLQWIYM